jgi:hypothetical protein
MMGHKKYKEIDFTDMTDEQYEEWLSCGSVERNMDIRVEIDGISRPIISVA